MSKSISIFIGILILGIGEIIFAKIVLKDKIKVSTLKLILTHLFVKRNLRIFILKLSIKGVSKYEHIVYKCLR